MYRILGARGEVRERRNRLRHPRYRRPELLATGPNQVWSWDITKLRAAQRWTYYYLYVPLDIFSRYAVGWLLAHRESGELAAELLEQSIHKQGVEPDQITVHADRGSAPTSKTLAQMMTDLGVKRSHSRPRVSNDSSFSESNFHTFKSRPDYPARFGSYEDARSFCRRTFDWYNHEHHHSGLVMLTPAQVHYGHAEEVLAERRIHRELQRQAPRRVPQRQLVFRPRARATPLGWMGCRLQRSQTAFCARQWDSATPPLSLTFLVGTLMAEAYDSRL